MCLYEKEEPVPNANAVFHSIHSGTERTGVSGNIAYRIKVSGHDSFAVVLGGCALPAFAPRRVTHAKHHPNTTRDDHGRVRA